MDENQTTNETELTDTQQLTYMIQFGILASLQIPSISCSLFIFYNLLFVPRHRRLVRQAVNHVLLLSVVNDFLLCSIELPFTMALLYRGVAAFTSDAFCLAWFLYGSATSTISIFLLAWLSVERYLFVFYERLFKRHYLIGHYLPLLFCIVYPIMYYTGVLFIYQCQNEFSYGEWACAAGCYQDDPFLGTFDWIVDLILPPVIVLLMSSLLFGRVIYQKCQLGQERILDKNKKLILQLILNACVYLCTWFPYAILGIVTIFIPDNELLNNLYENVFTYTSYVTPLLTPFFALITLPSLHKKFWRLFKRETNTKVVPWATLVANTRY